MLAYWKYKMSFMKIQRIELKPLFWHLSCFVFITIIIDLLLEKDFVGPLDFCPDNDVSYSQHMRRRLQKIKETRVEIGVKSLRCLGDQCVGTLARRDSWIARNGVIITEAEHNWNSERKKKFPFDFIKIVLNNLCRLTVIEY